MNLKEHLTKTAFWDIDFEKLDVDKKSIHVIVSVFNYGTWKDILAVYKYYGEEKIKQDIVQASWLRKEVLSFVCLWFELKEEDFKCIIQRRYFPQHYNF